MNASDINAFALPGGPMYVNRGMIEAEWWEYDSVDELAQAVSGDVGFIIESARDARDAALVISLRGSAAPALRRTTCCTLPSVCR